MRALGTEFKVGIFTLVAAAAIFYMMFVLSPKSFDSTNYVTYYTILTDASGLIPKSQVKTNGVIVGRVNAVDLEGNTTRITMEVKGDVKVPKGSKIEIRTRGLLGDTFIEIIRAEDNGQYIENGGLLPKSEDGNDMRALFAMAGGIGRDLKKITETLARTLGSEGGTNALENIIRNIESVTSDARGMMAENRRDLRSMISNIEKTTASLRQAMGDNPSDMVAIVQNIKQATGDLKQFAMAVRELVNPENKGRIDRIITSLDQSMNDIKSTTQNVRLVSDKVNRGEGTLGRLMTDDTALREIESAIKELRDVMAPANKTDMFVDYHGELRQDDSMQNYFNLAIHTRPDRYYLVGITDQRNNVERRTTEVVEDEPAEGDTPGRRTVVETTRKDDAIKVNVQFAKRWYFASLRFGLFETTGGIASDFYLFRDRARLSLEAFDFDASSTVERRTAHFKTYASLLFFDHLYAMAGVDDLTRTDPDTGKAASEPNYFFGAGLTFNDRDLRALFGAAAIGAAAK
jgi:phospholipid/cholesterol/gamma-HCH transport system substrate-binding protein